ncbi:MAG: aminopeptidase, partial [Pedobacter sp.]|nr:aminopeptidase [Pedobacter sp.]
MRNIIFFLLITFGFNGSAQDINYVRKTLDTLTGQNLWGRGYTKNGMEKAADFIASEFRTLGLKPMDGKDFRQWFSFPVNTFPGRMEVEINGQLLTPGKDFIVKEESIGFKFKQARLTQIDSTAYTVLG